MSRATAARDNTFPAANKAPSNSTTGRDVARDGVRVARRPVRTKTTDARGIGGSWEGPWVRARCADEIFPSRNRDATFARSPLPPASPDPSGDRPLEIVVGRVAFPDAGIPKIPKESRGLFVTSPMTAMGRCEILTRRDGPLEELDQLQRRWIHLHG